MSVTYRQIKEALSKMDEECLDNIAVAQVTDDKGLYGFYVVNHVYVSDEQHEPLHTGSLLFFVDTYEECSLV